MIILLNNGDCPTFRGPHKLQVQNQLKDGYGFSESSGKGMGSLWDQDMVHGRYGFEIAYVSY